MEQSKERNFVCKFCSKRFPCGKSLGGHIRTHTYENSIDSDEDETNKLKIGDNGGQSSYGLRENPKKNKRFVDQSVMIASKHHQQQLLLCRECGKGFNSLKALCGHMACHSDREKAVMDSQSDTETSSAPVRRRSKRVTKHHMGLVFGNTNHSNSASFANGNSSSVSEIEQEQEELALCLMMLSRDSSFKKVHKLVNSVAESSDNNSVILETKSSSGELKIINAENVGEFCYNADEILDIKEQKSDKQLKSTKDDDLLYDSDNSDSGYFRNGPKKVESDVSVDGFLGSSGFNKATMESGSKFNELQLQTKHDKNKFKDATEFGKELLKRGGSGRASTKYDLRKSKRICSYIPQKKSKYELKTNEFTESVYDSGENSLEADSCADTKQNITNFNKTQASSSKHTTASAVYKKVNGGKKKSKGHECPICFRVFKSGQALGGHKRSHFIGNQENSTVVIQQHVTGMHTLIDLNLPAPVDE